MKIRFPWVLHYLVALHCTIATKRLLLDAATAITSVTTVNMDFEV